MDEKVLQDIGMCVSCRRIMGPHLKSVRTGHAKNFPCICFSCANGDIIKYGQVFNPYDKEYCINPRMCQKQKEQTDLHHAAIQDHALNLLRSDTRNEFQKRRILDTLPPTLLVHEGLAEVAPEGEDDWTPDMTILWKKSHQEIVDRKDFMGMTLVQFEKAITKGPRVKYLIGPRSSGQKWQL